MDERDLHILDQFHANHNLEAREWPAWCYLFTQNRNPVQQEMSGRNGYTENGNIIAMETEDGARNNDRLADAEPVPENRQFILPPLQEEESVFPQPSVALQNLPPEQPWPREPPQCCICGKNMQAIQTSRPLRSRISDIIKKLSPQQLQYFITEINSYDRGILNSIPSQVTLFHEMVDAFIVPCLQRCRLSGRKCILCLLASVFQRVGRRDLANQVEAIQHSLG